MTRYKNIPELVLASACRFAGKTAMRHVSAGLLYQLTYKDIATATYRLATSLFKKGLRAGDRMAIFAENSPSWALSCLAAFRLGLTVVPLDAAMQKDEALTLLDQVEPKLILCGDRQRLELSGTRFDAKAVDIALLSGTGTSGDSLTLPSFGMEQVALLSFTQGTTGRPKVVALTHGNIMASALAVARHFDINSTDHLLSLLPLSQMLEFIAGLLVPLLQGATITYSRIPEGSGLKQLLFLEKPTVLVGAPGVFQELLGGIESSLERLPKTKQLSIAAARKVAAGNPRLSKIIFRNIHEHFGGRIKFWISGASPTARKLVEALGSLGIPLLSVYSVTEASAIVSACKPGQNKPGSAGKPLAGIDVKISEATEILLKGRGVMSGYWNDAGATSLAIVDGWLHTGDKGYFDQQGYLHVTGRMEPVIVTADGDRVHPGEVERFLTGCHGVKELCVFPRQGKRGTEVSAVIVSTEAERSKPDLEKRLKEKIASGLSQLAEYKRPTDYQLWYHDLPRTALGAVKVGEVMRLYEDYRQDKGAIKRSMAQEDLDDIGRTVCHILAEVMDPAILRGISPSGLKLFSRKATLSGDLAIDSFARLEIAIRLQQSFRIDVAEDALKDAATVEDLIALVKVTATAGSKRAQKQAHQLYSIDPYPWPPGRRGWGVLPYSDSPHIAALRRTVQIGTRLFLRLYNGLSVDGSDHLQLDPPYIIALGHANRLATPALVASFPASLTRHVQLVGAADHFFGDPLRALLSSYILNAVPFDRFGDFGASMEACEHLLRDGKILIVLPDGCEEGMDAHCIFKPYTAWLSITAGAPIIPACISGTQLAWPRGRLLPSPIEIRVKFGVPLYPPTGPASMRKCASFVASIDEAIEALKTPLHEQSPELSASS